MNKILQTKNLEGPKGLFRQSLQRRVDAILMLEETEQDFRDIFIDLRSKTYGNHIFREIGDFVAHRDVRDRGLIASIVTDFEEIAGALVAEANDLGLTLDQRERLGLANIRMASDSQISSRVAMDRKRASQGLSRAIELLRIGLIPAERDKVVFDTFTTGIWWKPAFRSEELWQEWKSVLVKNSLAEENDLNSVIGLRERLSVFVLSLLHGVEIKTGRSTVSLSAGFWNEQNVLECKAHINFHESAKPVHSPFCVFLTDLLPKDWCDPKLLDADLFGWNMPLRYSEGQLVAYT